MYCTQQQFCACQCLPQRLKPQTAKPVSAFLFSVVSGVDNRPYALEPSGRYVHYVPYISALLETMEFEIVKQDEVCLRKELNKPVLSTVFLVRKP